MPHGGRERNTWVHNVEVETLNPAMVNFICQLVWATRDHDIWLNRISGVFRLFRARLASELVDSLKKVALLQQVGITQSVEGLNRMNRWREGKFPPSARLLELSHQFSTPRPGPGFPLSAPPSLKTSGLELGPKLS